MRNADVWVRALSWIVVTAMLAYGCGKGSDDAGGNAAASGTESGTETGTKTDTETETGTNGGSGSAAGDSASRGGDATTDVASTETSTDVDGTKKPDDEADSGGDMTDELFPDMAKRDAFPIPANFGSDDPIWKAAQLAAQKASGIDPERFDDVYGEVNGKPITYGEVLEEAVMRFGEKFVDEYKHDLLLLAEIKGSGVTISEEEMKFGEEEFWAQLKQKGINNETQLMREFKWTPEFLRRKVFLNEGGKKVFAKDMGEDPKDTDPFFMQVWMTEMIGRYEMDSVYVQGNGLARGVLAKVGDREIRAVDVAPFLMPNLKSFHFEMAFDSLVERIAIGDALVDEGVIVSDEEIQNRIESERAKYAGSIFNYETMLSLAETNVLMERRKFRAWLGYNKMHGAPTDAELREHFAKHPVYFGRGAVAACEIKTLAIDPVTGKPKGDDAWDKALERALEAVAELEKGVPFQQLVMRYSEDPNTKKYENATLFGGGKKRVAGSIGIFPIKEGRMSNELASAAFACRKDEWVGPIRGRDGYHLLQLIDAKPPREMHYDAEHFTDMNDNGQWDQGEPFVDLNKNGNWNAGQEGNALDDFQTERVGKWIETVLAKAKVKRIAGEPQVTGGRDKAESDKAANDKTKSAGGGQAPGEPQKK